MSDYPDHLKPMPLKRCQHMTCKGMMVYGDGYLTAADEGRRTHSFVCLKTQSALGPDAALVTLSTCSPDRTCYEEL